MGGPVPDERGERKQFSPDKGKAEGGADSDAPGILVLLLKDGLDYLRIAPGVFPDDIGRSVRGGVVVHDHLEGKAGFLAHEALQRVFDIGRVVVRDAQHTDHDYFIHRSRYSPGAFPAGAPAD